MQVSAIQTITPLRTTSGAPAAFLQQHHCNQYTVNNDKKSLHVKSNTNTQISHNHQMLLSVTVYILPFYSFLWLYIEHKPMENNSDNMARLSSAHTFITCILLCSQTWRMHSRHTHPTWSVLWQRMVIICGKWATQSFVLTKLTAHGPRSRNRPSSSRALCLCTWLSNTYTDRQTHVDTAYSSPAVTTESQVSTSWHECTLTSSTTVSITILMFHSLSGFPAVLFDTGRWQVKSHSGFSMLYPAL